MLVLESDSHPDHSGSVADMDLSLDGHSLIGQCMHRIDQEGSMLIEDYGTFEVFEGTLRNRKQIRVRSGSCNTFNDDAMQNS